MGVHLPPNPLDKLWGGGGGGGGGGWLPTCGVVGKTKHDAILCLANLSPVWTVKPSIHVLVELWVTRKRSRRVCEAPKILSHPDSQLRF